MLWVEQGEKLWREAAGAGGQVLRLLPRRALEPEGRRGALSRSTTPRLGRLLNLEARIQQCRAERQKAAPLAYESQPLLALTALVAHQSRGLPMSVRDRRAGAAVLRGRPHALLRAPGPARSLLRAMPRGQLGQAPARRAHQPGPRQRLSHLSPGVADAGLAAPPPARLLPGRARRALRLRRARARWRWSSTSPGARKACRSRRRRCGGRTSFPRRRAFTTHGRSAVERCVDPRLRGDDAHHFVSTTT